MPRIDEHDPEFDPEFYAPPQESWWDFFMALGRAVALSVAIALVLWILKV